MAKKESKTNSFEDDLFDYIKIKKDNKEIFNNFPKLYDEFILKNDFSIDELKGDTIRTVSTNKFREYISSDYRSLKFILSALIKFGYIKISEINRSIMISTINLNLSIYRLKNINSLDNLMNVLRAVIQSDNVHIKMILEWVIKTYVLREGEKLKEKIEYINKAYPYFISYYNSIINKECISDELINSIVDLMLDPNYVITKEEYRKEEPVIRKIMYTSDFGNYTKFHNLTVKMHHDAQVARELDKKERQKKETLNSQPEVTPDIVFHKRQEIEENKETKEDLNKKENIKRMVESYLPGICDEEKTSITEDMLPNPYDPNYNEIIIGLLKAYEEYTNNQKKNSMGAFNKYNDLVFMVENIKR